MFILTNIKHMQILIIALHRRSILVHYSILFFFFLNLRIYHDTFIIFCTELMYFCNFILSNGVLKVNVYIEYIENYDFQMNVTLSILFRFEKFKILQKDLSKHFRNNT